MKVFFKLIVLGENVSSVVDFVREKFAIEVIEIKGNIFQFSISTKNREEISNVFKIISNDKRSFIAEIIEQ